jgi:hypothetical protein
MNNLNLVLSRPDVRNILPSRFSEDYPNLVLFLEKYYEHNKALHTAHEDVLNLRNLDETEIKSIDNIFFEIGNALSTDKFDDPVFLAKIISFITKSKGTPLSAQLFFRSFFNVEPTISYPKNEIFVVNESLLGPEYGNRVINNDRWQIHSIFIKTSLQQATWESLYKIFVHPAGFWLGAEVLIENKGVITLSGPVAILDSSANSLSLESLASGVISLGHTDITLLIDSGSGDNLTTSRMNPFRTVQYFDSATMNVLAGQYHNIGLLGNANGITMDTTDSIAAGPDFSNTFETYDMSQYERFFRYTWILSGATWNDEGIWIDDANWKE